jgi:hypothetical protein
MTRSNLKRGQRHRRRRGPGWLRCGWDTSRAQWAFGTIEESESAAESEGANYLAIIHDTK